MYDEQKELAESLWKSGKTAGEIVKLLGNRPSRNAVMGHLYRSGLLGGRSKKPVPTTPKKHKHRNGRNRISVDADAPTWGVPLPLPPPTDTSTRSFNTISGPSYDLQDLGRFQCRWPINNPGDRNFCWCSARTRFPPYCTAHAELAHART